MRLYCIPSRIQHGPINQVSTVNFSNHCGLYSMVFHNTKLESLSERRIAQTLQDLQHAYTDILAFIIGVLFKACLRTKPRITHWLMEASEVHQNTKCGHLMAQKWVVQAWLQYILCERLNLAALVWLCVGTSFLQVELQCRMDRRCHRHRSAQSHRLAVQHGSTTKWWVEVHHPNSVWLLSSLRSP